MSEPVGIILFHGGPCDAQRAAYDETQATAGLTSCGGVVYHVGKLSRDSALAYWLASGYSQPDAESAADDTFVGLLPGAVMPHEFTLQGQAKAISLPHDPIEAWAGFWRGIGSTVPEHVNRARRLRRRIRALGVR